MLLYCKNYAISCKYCYFITFSFSSLGDHYASLFLNAGDITGSPQTLEKRRERAKLILAGAQEMCDHVLNKVFMCYDLNVLRPLFMSLKCLYNLCSYYSENVSHTKIGIREDDIDIIYNPDFLPAFQKGCFFMLSDIAIFCKYVVPFVREIETDDEMISIL